MVFLKVLLSSKTVQHFPDLFELNQMKNKFQMKNKDGIDERQCCNVYKQ